MSNNTIHTTYIDAAVTAGIGVVAFVLSVRLDLFEKLFIYSQRHENFEVDELLTLAMVLFICLAIFSMRRWRDLVLENRMRLELQGKNEQMIAELQNKLEEIKVLEGLIPICSNCHKVRGDQGYWQQVEIYIEERSKASFTHSLCPDCLEKLYPKYYKKNQLKLDKRD